MHFIVALCPEMTMAQAAALLAARQVSLDDAAPLLTSYYSSDPKALAAALKDVDTYPDWLIEDYLIHTLHVTFPVMLSLKMTNDYGLQKSSGRELLQFLDQDYWNVPPATYAAELYKAGWTEANEGQGLSGYGSNDLVWGLVVYSAGNEYLAFNALVSIGLAPNTIATMFYYYKGKTVVSNYDWVLAWRNKGYTATDMDVWLDDVVYPDDPYQATALLAHVFVNLTDILTALKVVYNPSLSAMQKIFTVASQKYGLGWSVYDIQDVLKFFADDPLQKTVSSMLASGSARSKSPPP
jgi:hypothetical protein